VPDASFPHVDPDDTASSIGGVKKRFAFKPPDPDPVLMQELYAYTRKFINKHFKPLSPDTDLSVETWLSGTSYPEWRKDELRQIYAKFPLKFGVKLPKKVTSCKSFIKRETYDTFKHSRAINSRSDAFKCLIGPVIKQIESVVYQYPAFIKHVPVNKRPQYIMDLLSAAGFEYGDSDYTSFEAQFVPATMEVEMILYEHMVGHLPHAKDIIYTMRDVMMGRNECFFKGFSVSVQATRMSGEMSTSLGNGFANLMFLRFMAKKVGCRKIRCAVEGDDSINRMVGTPPTTADFEKLGLVIKINRHASINTASFCGIVFDPDDKVNITDPRKVLLNFSWLDSRYVHARQSKLRALLRCKALSLAHQFPGAPIIQELAQYGLRVTRGADVRQIVESRAFDEYHRQRIRDASNSVVSVSPVLINTRLLMERMWGVSVEDQLSIERYLASKQDLSPIELPRNLIKLDWFRYAQRYVLPLLDGERHLPFIPSDVTPEQVLAAPAGSIFHYTSKCA